MKPLFRLAVCACLLLSPQWSGASQQPSADHVEILVNGRQFSSMKEYRREKIKEQLEKTLSAESFKIFSEAELMAILREVKLQKQKEQQGKSAEDGQAMPESIQIPNKEGSGIYGEMLPDTDQLQDMLDTYLDTHTDAEPIKIDPHKVKDITILPKSSKSKASQ